MKPLAPQWTPKQIRAMREFPKAVAKKFTGSDSPPEAAVALVAKIGEELSRAPEGSRIAFAASGLVLVCAGKEKSCESSSHSANEDKPILWEQRPSSPGASC